MMWSIMSCMCCRHSEARRCLTCSGKMIDDDTNVFVCNKCLFEDLATYSSSSSWEEKCFV